MWTEDQIRERNARIFGHQVAVAESKSAAAICVNRTPRPRMNRWETAYDAELRAQWCARLIDWYGFEAIKLRLAQGAYYTPDFAVIEAGRLSFVEVKGFWRDDALVKFKVAAEQFPFAFVAIRKKRQAEGGGWDVLRRIEGNRRNAKTSSTTD